VEEKGEEDATFHLKLGDIDVVRDDNVLCMQEFCEHFLHCWDGIRKHDNVDANDQKPNEPQEENVEVTTIVLGLCK